MRSYAKSFKATPLVLLMVGVAALTPRAARADDTIRHPGDHPHYSVELEPHGIVGWGGGEWASAGFGVGGRVSINLTHDGFIRTINNSVAIGFGADWVHYSASCSYDPNFPGDCYGANYYASADFFQFPVVLQWNFYVARHWSVFAEPGLYIYHGIYNAPSEACNGPGLPGCGPYGSDTGVGPAFWVGARYHFTDVVALTFRLGYPDIATVGVSFMP